MRINGCLEAIFGGLLRGVQALRYIFIDEAGTSALEPVTVVTGIIANADDHILLAEALVAEALGAVPEWHREGFVFHAKQIFGDSKLRERWPLNDRLGVLMTMMSIPSRLGMGKAVSAHWKNSVDFSDSFCRLGISQAQSEHMFAFYSCVAIAALGIRKYAGPREVGTLVVEDVPEMQKFLKLAPRILRENPMFMPEELRRRTISDEEAGHSVQNGDQRVARIRKTIHFVGKSDDPLVQMADACAYGFRRFFAGQRFGPEFARAIMGDELRLRNFGSPSGAEVYWPR